MLFEPQSGYNNPRVNQNQSIEKDFSYPNPPIVEALLDIRVTLNEGRDFDEAFGEFYDVIKSEFPHKQTRNRWKARLDIKKGEVPITTTTERGVIGYLCKSDDGARIVQARKDGFTFNQLRPYKNWDNLKQNAYKYWELYKKHFRPTKIDRVALRYTNLIELPGSMKDFKEYVLTIPEIAQNLPQVLSEFFVRLVIPEIPEKGNIAIVTETIDRNKLTDEVIPLIFDIDVFRSVNLDPENKELQGIFESLRTYKNKIFQESLTEKTKKMFL